NYINLHLFYIFFLTTLQLSFFILFSYTTLFRSDPSLKIGDLVIAVSSCTTSNYAAQYHLPGSYAPTASFDLARRAAQFCEQKGRSEEHTSELQSRFALVCRLLLEQNNNRPVLPI